MTLYVGGCACVCGCVYECVGVCWACIRFNGYPNGDYVYNLW